MEFFYCITLFVSIILICDTSYGNLNFEDRIIIVTAMIGFIYSLFVCLAKDDELRH